MGDANEKSLTMVIVFGTATLRDDLPAEQVAKLPRVVGKDRKRVMDAILSNFKHNRHLDQEEAQRMLAAAAALALTDQIRATLDQVGYGGARLTYEITPIGTVGGPDDYNWRLIDYNWRLIVMYRTVH
jgi:hypothetical protein